MSLYKADPSHAPYQDEHEQDAASSVPRHPILLDWKNPSIMGPR